VVSTLALMDFHEETKRMRLVATQPGVSVDQVLAETGFELIVPDAVEENEAPLAEELRILREEVDRDRLYI
jgi:glutaconate CoA-transferase subunit B